MEKTKLSINSSVMQGFVEKTEEEEEMQLKVVIEENVTKNRSFCIVSIVSFYS